MEKYLKLQGDKKLEVKFTPRTMSRFSRETKLSMGYFMGFIQTMQNFSTDGKKMTQDDQIRALNSIGYSDLQTMMFAGCPSLKTMDAADELLDDLEGSLFENIAVLIESFTEFMDGKILPAGVLKTLNPTQPKKPKKQKEKATNPAA